MMVNSYYGIYQAERGKTAAEIRAADAVRRSLRGQRRPAGPAAPDAG
jgi:hypothetical protein